MQRRGGRYQLCTPQLFSGGRLRPGSQATDGDIVRAVLAGDRERYARLVERYRDRYARYATRMLGSMDAAEDAVQDAFVRAYDQLAQCKEPEVFVLKHVEGLSYGEIAERLSTSIPSLKMRMHRAYDTLREQLRDHT